MVSLLCLSLYFAMGDIIIVCSLVACLSVCLSHFHVHFVFLKWLEGFKKNLAQTKVRHDEEIYRARILPGQLKVKVTVEDEQYFVYV